MDNHTDRRRSGCPVRLVRKAQRGNKRAFAELWKRYAPTVNSILLTMVQESDADDMTQEVAVSALRALPTLRQPESFPAWLCTIARNMGRDALESKRACRDVPINAALAIAAPPAGDVIEADEILEHIRTLPECYREPLMLRLLLEMKPTFRGIGFAFPSRGEADALSSGQCPRRHAIA